MKIIKEYNLKGNKIQRQAQLIFNIAKESSKVVLEDDKVYVLAGTIGLVQGLKYNGSFIRGTRAGVATMGAVIGTNIVRNIVVNIDEIKNA